MRLLHKWAVGVGAFCALWCFLVLLFFVSGGGNEVASIERVLRQDNSAAENAENVQEVVGNMRSIRISGCPADFREAYVAHIHAWESLAEVEQQAIAVGEHYSSGEAIAEAFIRGAFGDPLGKAGEAIAADRQVQWNYNYAQEQIRTTYQDVERVAARYGAGHR